MATLTRQLLAFARREIITPALLTLNDVVAGMHSLLMRLIGDEFRVVIKPDSTSHSRTAIVARLNRP